MSLHTIRRLCRVSPSLSLTRERASMSRGARESGLGAGEKHLPFPLLGNTDAAAELVVRYAALQRMWQRRVPWSPTVPISGLTRRLSCHLRL